MEGLIPLALRALKRNKVRRQYTCLSVGTAQTYQIADFYDFGANNYDHDHGQYGGGRGKVNSPPRETRGSTSGHRRFASAGVTGGGGYSDFNYDCDEVSNGGGIGRTYSPNNNQIIKRYRSHRMFSCITGTI